MKFKWMKNQTGLTLQNLDIDTLEDLVFFPNLQNLNLSFCSKLKDLKGISNCTNLSTFTILGSNRTSNRFQ